MWATHEVNNPKFKFFFTCPKIPRHCSAIWSSKWHHRMLESSTWLNFFQLSPTQAQLISYLLCPRFFTKCPLYQSEWSRIPAFQMIFSIKVGWREGRVIDFINMQKRRDPSWFSGNIKKTHLIHLSWALEEWTEIGEEKVWFSFPGIAITCAERPTMKNSTIRTTYERQRSNRG